VPTYEYKCNNEDCEAYFECSMTISEYRKSKDQDCPECGSGTRRVITTCNFVLQGDSWPGKANRINTQMKARQNRLSKRQKERKRESPVAGLMPNVGGERTESWKDAQKLARDQGKDSLSYTPLVQAEEASK